MTFVGKILVVVITAFSLIFLGISAVVFTTAKNWKSTTVEATKKKYDELKRQNNATVAELETAKKALEESKKVQAAAQKTLDNRINVLNAEIKRSEDEYAKSKTDLTTAQQNARTTLEEVDAVKKDTGLLHEQTSAVEKQANEYKLRQTELNDQIRQLNRMLESATGNGKDLRDRARGSNRPTL